MKNLLLIIMCVFINSVNAQTPKKSENLSKKTLNNIENREFENGYRFTNDDVVEIQQILGKQMSAVIDTKGRLAIILPKSISQIKSTRSGEFDVNKANSTTVHPYKFVHMYHLGFMWKEQSKSKMVALLGDERFNKLAELLVKRVPNSKPLFDEAFNKK